MRIRDMAAERAHKDRYYFGGNRELAIQRDKERCVQCGMSRAEHRKTFKLDITVNHIDGKGAYSKIKNHALSNLETLCLQCHGSKDGVRSHGGANVILNAELVRKVRRSYAKGKSFYKLAARHGVHYDTLRDAINRRTWKWV